MKLESPNGYGLMAELELAGAGVQKLINAISRQPLAWSELSDIGHCSRMGQQYRKKWTDYRTPVGFLGVRQFIGARLLLETTAAYGFPYAGESVIPLLESRAPVRYISRALVEQMAEANAVIPWPGLKAPYPSLLVMVPRGACTATVSNTAPDEVAAIAIHCCDGAGGLELAWSAYGWNGTVWSDGWSVKPLLDIPISRLAWGIIAILNTSIDVEAPAAPTSPGGMIRSKRERPGPLWIQPRRHVIRTARPAESTGQTRSPHWRQAHPHQFWTGKKGNQKLITKWLPAIWVDPALQSYK